MNTILITCASSGIGLETALYFSKHGWNVAATMRNPSAENQLNEMENLKCIRLDVTDIATVTSAINKTIELFGSIDVVVNNAGYGTKGLFEATTIEDAKALFNVNVFGIMNVMWAVLPIFRQQKSGTIINISSQSGVIGAPINSLYNASKFAVAGFSESIMYELETIGIDVKLILLGAVNTEFLNSQKFVENDKLIEYEYINNTVVPKMKNMLSNGESPSVIAKEIYKAATDNTSKLRYLAGKKIKTTYKLKKLLPFGIVRNIVKKSFNR